MGIMRARQVVVRRKSRSRSKGAGAAWIHSREHLQQIATGLNREKLPNLPGKTAGFALVAVLQPGQGRYDG